MNRPETIAVEGYYRVDFFGSLAYLRTGQFAIPLVLVSILCLLCVAPVLKHGLRSHSPLQVDDVVNIYASRAVLNGPERW